MSTAGAFQVLPTLLRKPLMQSWHGVRRLYFASSGHRFVCCGDEGQKQWQCLPHIILPAAMAVPTTHSFIIVSMRIEVSQNSYRFLMPMDICA